ncbi:hypothetical protein HGH93_30715 [Chitinophaga polysaccharea]|uniref:hypothetical protein n=1 Tax=Chitinophaga TaxID=79328 RepID=UPI0014553A9F|nr:MULTISPECIES: hypothetical protein [Chitinophaga]NLR62504.1 hypothetical protein [Chitinophaga polysaccharea]NLU92326.1 hypothetical protein [Chitinophaga sp. Ak27]
MKKSLILLCAVLMFCYPRAFAQKMPDFGEGIVKIAHYFVPSKNVLAPDTAGRLFTNYTYYVKGSKVLKREGGPSSFLGSDKRITKQDDHLFKSALSARLITPEYLLDFQQDKAYTFYTKKGQLMVAVSQIRGQRSDLFFRALLSNGRNNNCILEATANQEDSCTTSYGYGLVGKDSAFFQFSPRRYPVESPLSFFFPAGTSPFITLLWLPSPGTGKDGKTFVGYSVLAITEVIDAKLPDSLFTIPADAILKENVSMQEMYGPNMP